MKKQIQGYVAGLLSAAVLIGGAAYARSGSETITANYDDIRVYIDNTLAELTDANGTRVEPFVYNGTTYLPVRGVAQAMGAQVTWDGATKSVHIWDKMVPGETFMMEVCPPYQIGDGRKFLSAEGESFTMDGKKRSNGMVLYSGNSSALFNLDGKYKSLSLDIGHIDWYDQEKTISFIVDGKVVKTITLDPEQLAEHITIPLNYGLQLRIVTDEEWFNCQIGIADMVVE